MTTTEQQLAELEQQEIEAWREYQLHVKQGEELCRKWRLAYHAVALAKAKQAPQIEV